VFDRDQYARFVQFQMGMSVTAYEEKVRKDLLAEKLREFLSLSADISETEVKDEFIARNESVDARFLVFSAATFTDAARERVKEAVTDDDAAAFAAREAEKIKKFYDDNAARWKKEDDTTRPLDEVKTAIARELLVADRIAALVNAEAGKALSLLSSASYKPELLKKDIPDWAVEFQEQTDLRKSAKYLRDIGIAPELIGNLFTHQPVPGYLPQVYTVDDKRVIAFVGKHTPADMVRFETEKEQLRRELHSAKTRTITDAYAKKLREKAKIEINRNWLAAFGETGDQ
jgi:hypothetical protein